MPNVSEEFVAHAVRLAQGVQGTIDKGASVKTAAAPSEALRANAELVADTLVGQGLLQPAEKEASVKKLLNHEECLHALNKIAQMKQAAPVKSAAATKPVEAESMGAPERGTEKRSVDYRGEDMRESDRILFAELGL
jgi:hypothetical protein